MRNPLTSSLVISNLSSIGSTGIEVRVGKGDNQNKFIVHKDLVISRSRFFFNALRGNWKEAEENAITFPEDDPAVFGLYVQLLYLETLPMDNFSLA